MLKKEPRVKFVDAYRVLKGKENNGTKTGKNTKRDWKKDLFCAGSTSISNKLVFHQKNYSTSNGKIFEQLQNELDVLQRQLDNKQGNFGSSASAVQSFIQAYEQLKVRLIATFSIL